MDAAQKVDRNKVRAAARVLAVGFLVALFVAPLGSPAVASASSSKVQSGSANLMGYDLTTAGSITVVVNKVRPLNPVTYGPAKLGTYNLAKPASDALVVMRAAMAKAHAGDLLLASGYRSYASQKAILDRNVNRFGLAAALEITAKPGYSEHQTGLAADLWATGQGCRAYPCFASTSAGKWLAANAWQFGFILRYPSGASKITGYSFEPWHFRYVGKPLATAMHQAKATVLETFFGLPAAPKYLSK